MIKLYNFDELKPEEILNRDIRAEKNVEDVVDGIIADVRARGDEALKDYALKLDGAKIDALQVTQEEIEDAFANMDIAGYNYGIYRYKHDLKKYPQRLILGSETFCNDAYKFRELAKQEPRLVGDFVWAGMDYLGEVMVGSW